MTSDRPEDRVSKLVSWLFPSLKDWLFLSILTLLLISGGSSALNDADTGWHIRNGEQILQTREWVYADSFSYSNLGRHWFAWEWLSDVVMALIHRTAGLNGLVVWAGLTFTATFVLLFDWMLRRGANIALSALFTLAAGLAAYSHWLARPHLFTLLLLLVWYMALETAQRKRKIPWTLSAVMVLWVNLHPGFVMGIALAAIYALGNLLSSITTIEEPAKSNHRLLARQFALFAGLCLMLSIANPYGLALHRHIGASFLHSQFLADNIDEWASPDFHGAATKFYELILLSSVLVAGVSWRRLTFVNIGLLVFMTHLSLNSRRHIPLYLVIVVPIVVDYLSQYVVRLESEGSLGHWAKEVLKAFNTFSGRILAFENQFKALVIPTGSACLLAGLCLNGGHWGKSKLLDAHFNPDRFPVRAVNFAEKQNSLGNLFTTDAWGGYMIYRVYPKYRVFLDGRFDMYGQQFIEEYLSLRDLHYDWKNVLSKYQINWILLPVNYGLASVLKERSEWQVVYDDQQAIIFTRRTNFSD